METRDEGTPLESVGRSVKAGAEGLRDNFAEYREQYRDTLEGVGEKLRENRGVLLAGLAAAAVGGAAYAIARSKRESGRREARGQQRYRGFGDSKGRSLGTEEFRFVRTVTILKPAAELYSFWRNEENAPRFMKYVQSVRRTGENTSRWVAQVPGGPKLEWESEVYDEREGEYMAWRTVRGDWQQHGRLALRPAPGDRGTEVRLEMTYEVPGGKLGRAYATFIGREPEQVGQTNLMRFKQLMEAGEIATVDGQPRGKRGFQGGLMQMLLREPEAERRTGRLQQWAVEQGFGAASFGGRRQRQPGEHERESGERAVGDEWRDRWQRAGKGGERSGSWSVVRGK